MKSITTSTGQIYLIISDEECSELIQTYDLIYSPDIEQKELGKSIIRSLIPENYDFRLEIGYYTNSININDYIRIFDRQTFKTVYFLKQSVIDKYKKN